MLKMLSQILFGGKNESGDPDSHDAAAKKFFGSDTQSRLDTEQGTHALTLSDPSMLAAFMPKTTLATRISPLKTRFDLVPIPEVTDIGAASYQRATTLINPQDWRMHPGQTARETFAHIQELLEMSRLSLLGFNEEIAKNFFEQAWSLRNLMLTDVELSKSDSVLYNKLRRLITPEDQAKYEELGFFSLASKMMGLPPVTENKLKEQAHSNEAIIQKNIDAHSPFILNLIHKKIYAACLLLSNPTCTPISRDDPTKFVPYDELIARARLNTASALTLIGIILETHPEPQDAAHVYVENLIKGVVDPSQNPIDVTKAMRAFETKYGKGIGIPAFKHGGPALPHQSLDV